MNEEKKKQYESPQVEVVEVAVEKGFAASNGADLQSLENEDWD